MIILTTGLQITYTNKLKFTAAVLRPHRHLRVVIITRYVSLENIFTVTSASGFSKETPHCWSSFHMRMTACKSCLCEVSKTASIRDTVLPFTVNHKERKDNSHEMMHDSALFQLKVAEFKSLTESFHVETMILT